MTQPLTTADVKRAVASIVEEYPTRANVYCEYIDSSTQKPHCIAAVIADRLEVFSLDNAIFNNGDRVGSDTTATNGVINYDGWLALGFTADAVSLIDDIQSEADTPLATGVPEYSPWAELPTVKRLLSA